MYALDLITPFSGFSSLRRCQSGVVVSPVSPSLAVVPCEPHPYTCGVPLSAASLQHEKASFLGKFDLKPTQAGWLDKGLRDAMRASARRGHLYRPGMRQADRNLVRSGWSQELKRLADLYAANDSAVATQVQFENDLMALRAFMNTNFGGYFGATAVNGYPPGFRIAHAQKSLSLILKHFWCNGEINEPPCCPVDRRILVIAGATGSAAKWTDLDTLNVYRQKLGRLRTASANFAVQPISLAQWELYTFNHI